MGQRRVTPLKIAIVSSGMTIRELSEASGVSDTQISRLSGGHNKPNLLTQRALAEALNTTVDALWPELEDVAA
jgi:transcriptional regulator with XRE-family HTH domain